MPIESRSAHLPRIKHNIRADRITINQFHHAAIINSLVDQVDGTIYDATVMTEFEIRLKAKSIVKTISQRDVFELASEGRCSHKAAFAYKFVSKALECESTYKEIDEMQACLGIKPEDHMEFFSAVFIPALDSRN